MARGIELATAYVTLAIESSDIAKSIAADFGQVERTVAPKAGKSIGKAMARGFEAEAPDLSRLEREFEDAQKRIVQAEERATADQEALGRKVEIAQRKKAEAVEKYGEESSQALTAIDRMIVAEQKLEAATMKAESEQKRLNDQLGKAETALKGAKDGTDRLDDSVRDSGDNAEKAGKDWGGFGDAVSKALKGDFKGAFSSLKSEASGSADEVADEFKSAGSSAGGGDGFGGSFVGSIGKFLGPAIAAAGIGKLLSDAIFAGMDEEANADRMAASLGLSEEDAKAYSDIISNIYADGWGADKAEVGVGVEAFLSWSPELKANGDMLEDVTSKALALADVFGVEIPHMAQLAAQQVEHGFAADTSEALDLLAAGFQKVPTSLRDEYSDALEEYTPHLANLGFTGEQAFALLANSAEMGQYGIDKAGDAMKELSIRAAEMDGTTGDAYESLGLNAQDMANAIVAGGDDARLAVDKIATALLDVKDPAEQAQLAVDLFGTPLEDLGKQNIPDFITSLDGMDLGLGQVDGRAQDVADTLSDNTATEVEKVKRGFSELSTEIGEGLIVGMKDAYEWISDKLGPVIEWLSENILPPMVEVFKKIWTNLTEEIFPALQELWRIAVEDLGPSFTMLKDLIVVAWDNIWAAISIAWDLISGVFTAIINILSGDFSGAWTTMRDAVTGVWDTLWGKTKGIWNDHIYPFLGKIGGWFNDNLVSPIKTAIDKIGDAWNSLKSMFSTPINWIIDYVINGAVRPVVNTVSSALGLSWRMGEVSRINASPNASNGSSGGGGRPLAMRAKGGYTTPGWTLVGEEGPELVNFSAPNRVYTAEETAQALSLAPGGALSAEGLGIASQALTTQSPADLERAAGASPAEAVLPMGDSFMDTLGGAWSDLWRGTWSAVTTVAGKAVEFVRGGLGKAAEIALNPVKGAIRSNVGIPFVADGFVNRIDDVIGWVKGVDKGEGEIGTKKIGPLIEGIVSENLAASAGGDLDPTLLGHLLNMPGGGGSGHPMPGRPLTSRFGRRWGGNHAGVDWAAPVGTPVRAWRSGVVTGAGWNTLAGRTGIGVLLAHAAGMGSYYGHLSQALVGRGSRVNAGQLIGLSGNTGRSTGPHLHFEISRGGPQSPVNPLPFLHDNGGWIEPGLTTIANKTRKPEAVLKPAESEAFIALAEVAAGRRETLPRTLVLKVGEREFTGYLEDVIGGNPGVAMANDLVEGYARHRKAAY